MKKFLPLLLSIACLYSGSALAQDEALATPLNNESLPESILPIEEAMPGQMATDNDEATAELRYRRCPRGYRLVAYRSYRGRIIVTRYRCIRYRGGRY